MKNKSGKILNLILWVLPILCVFALWAGCAAAIDSEYILPSVSATFSALFILLGRSEFYLALAFTLGRSLIAFIVSFALAFILSAVSKLVKNAEKVIAPLISIMRALPTVAVVLLLLFWTNSKVAPVIVTMLVVLPTTYTQLKSGLDGVDKITVDAGLVDGASRFRAFTEIELPQTIPNILTAIGGGISLNFKLMVAAEVLAATANSLGYLLNTSKVYFEIANMIAVVVVAVAIGVVIETLFNFLSKKADDFR